MGRLLSLGHGETRFRAIGSMDSPVPSQDIVGAMEETEDRYRKLVALGLEALRTCKGTATWRGAGGARRS